MKKNAVFILSFLCFSYCCCQTDASHDANCFTILVGKNASSDGAVLLAHNEDDAGELLVDMHKVPRGSFANMTKIDDSTTIASSNHWSYLWIEIPGQKYADGLMNEFGVTICSNEAQSKEKNENGRIGYYLRKALAAEARSAREAVKIAGQFIEEYGYSYSGRAYSVADPNEAWVLEVVRGKHWIAKRVPDDEIVVIPNYYVITDVNLRDTMNYLGSPDLIEYAVHRGWYNPQSSRKFDFRSAYGNPDKLQAQSNIARKWVIINYFSEKQYTFQENFPFSLKPKRKVTFSDLTHALRNHYEGTELEMNPADNKGNPHKNAVMRVCSESNQYSVVAQLRRWIPSDIGNVLWFAPRRLCLQPFIPIYFGITEIPMGYEKESYDKAEAAHFKNDRNLKEMFPEHASWTFSEYAARIDSNYAMEIPGIETQRDTLQVQLLRNQAEFERRVSEVYSQDPLKARRMLTEYSSEYALRILRDTRQRMDHQDGGPR